MYHIESNAGNCKHSKAHSVIGLDSHTLAVYCTCKHPNKKTMGRQHYLPHPSLCQGCCKYKMK